MIWVNGRFDVLPMKQLRDVWFSESLPSWVAPYAGVQWSDTVLHSGLLQHVLPEPGSLEDDTCYTHMPKHPSVITLAQSHTTDAT